MARIANDEHQEQNLIHKRYLALLEYLPQRVFFKDRDSVFVSVNTAFADDLGMRPEEVIGKTDYDIHPKEAADKFRADELRIMAARQPETREQEDVRLPSGTVAGSKRVLEVVKAPVIDDDGEVVGVFGLTTDITERKRAEAERDRLFSSSLDMMGIAGFDGYFKDVNPAFEKTLGFSGAMLLEKPFLDFVHPEDRAATIAEMGKLSTGALTLNFENRYLCKDGSYKWLEWIAVPVIEEGFIYAVARDMTERKRAEKALRESEERVRLMVEGVKDYAIFMLDPDGYVVSWNAGAERIKGYAAEEIIGQHFSRFYPSEDITSGKSARELKLATTNGWFEDEGWRVRKDGSRFWANVVVTAIYDEEGQLRGFSKVSCDMTERKQAEEEIKRLNEDLERRVTERTAQLETANRELENEVASRERAAARSSFLAEASDILASSLDYEITLTSVARLAVPHIADWCNVDVVDEDGQVRRVALAHVDPAKEALAYDFIRRFPPDPNADTAVKIVLRTGEPLIIPEITDSMLEESVRNPEQLEFLRELHPTSSMTVPLIAHGARGKALGAITLLAAESGFHYGVEDQALAEEIARRAAIAIENARLYGQSEKARSEAEAVGAELKRTVAELVRSNEELQQFAYVASHDLQEPLRMVASYTQLLSRRYKGKLDSDADEFIAYAVDGANRMQRLINDLLSYSRVSTRASTFEPTECELILNQVVANLRAAIEENSAVITHDPMPTVLADQTQLVQLFQNLIGNAIKFRGKEPPYIHIGVEQKGREWLFCVRDNGIGIDPQYANRIFVIFQRLHSKAEYPGTGIGLAVCKKIVERHGGHIWVESQPGQGSTFYFTVPTNE